MLVVGGGFGAFHALHRLERIVPSDQAELVLISPTDYLLYSPLLPEVVTGVVEPRHVAVSLRQALRRTRVVPGQVTAIDLVGRAATVATVDGSIRTEPWDRLVLAPGAVSRQVDVPSLVGRAHSVKTVVDALRLRDHLLTEMDVADALPDTAAGRAERRERLTVVAVGAGYTGIELVGQVQAWLVRVSAERSGSPADLRIVLVNHTTRVVPELGRRLGAHVLDVLHRRGIEVRLGVGVAAATPTDVTLTDGTVVPTRTVAWSAGAVPSPLIAALGLPTTGNRLVVAADLSVPGYPCVWAVGDAAAVPDLAVRTALDGHQRVTPPTAQHAQRQGVAVARNVAATLGVGRARPYRHRDLGLVADLGRTDGVARTLGVPVTGRLARAVTRAYHLYALPGAATKVRVATDWALASTLPTQPVALSGRRAAEPVVAVGP